MVLSMKRNRQIDPRKYYTISQTAALLRDGGVNTADTVKRYCRNGKLEGKKKGAKGIWHVLGSSIIALREKWDLED
jgi:hypothetical protein